MTRKITVLDKHIQRAKKRDWMQSQKEYFSGEKGNFKGSTARVIITPSCQAIYSCTKNYEND